MRTWVKATLAGVGVIAVGFAVLAGTSAYYVLRNLDTRSASEADVAGDFQAIRTRFGADVRFLRVDHVDSVRPTSSGWTEL